MRAQPVHRTTSCGTVHRGVGIRAAGESETKGTGTRLRYLGLLGPAATGVAPPQRACGIILGSIFIAGKDKLLQALSFHLSREAAMPIGYVCLECAGQFGLVCNQRLGRINTKNITGFLLQTNWGSKV